MKAALIHEYGGTLDVVDVTLRDCGPLEARVRVDASGICHTDMSIAAGLAGDSMRVPLILGHEGTGIVTAVGRDVRSLAVGDRVIGSFVPACGRCWHCVRGESTQCERAYTEPTTPTGQLADGSAVSPMAALGTFAEEMLVRETALVKVRSQLPAEQLALIGCGVTTGVGSALWTARVQPGSSVAVFGCGGVGQFAVQGARIAGAARIFAVDPVATKRSAASLVGATDEVDPAAGDVVEQLREATGGRGVDYAIEVVGSVAVIGQAFEAVRRRGTVVVVGMPAWDAQLTISPFVLFNQEKRILGSFYGSANVHEHFQTLVDLAEAGRLDIGAAVSRRVTLDGITDAFAALERGEVIRAVVG